MTVAELKKKIDELEAQGCSEFEIECINGLEEFASVKSFEIDTEQQIIRICAWA